MTKKYLLLLLIAFSGFASQAQIIMNINLDTDEERSSFFFRDNYSPLRDYLAKVTDKSIELSFGQDPTTALQRTRSGYYGIVVGPAHIIGTATRYGYSLIGYVAQRESMAFVVRKDSGIRNFQDLRGKRIAMPPDDSLAAYLARGEFNAMHLEPKKLFSSLSTFHYQGSALMGLTLGTVDVAVASNKLLEQWPQRNDFVVVRKTQDVPGLGIAINKSLPEPIQRKIIESLLDSNKKNEKLLASVGFSNFVSGSPGDYAYVSTLGYFTPTRLPGVQIVNALEVKELIDHRAATLYDTRSADEYQEAHIDGALSLPYREHSKKEIDFDSAKDQFLLTDVVRDKSAPLIFQCNGAECWKSYKASVWAQRAGYQKLYWFRGGFPEWKAQSLPIVASGPAPTAKSPR